MSSDETVYRPSVGETCIAVPHGTDWGFDSLDPAGVVIKAYDGDYVWMLANRTHYITTRTERVTFIPVTPKHKPIEQTLRVVVRGGPERKI